MGTFVQQGQAEQTGNNTTACSIALTVTAGNAVVFGWACEHQTATVTVAGGGNTYVQPTGNGMPLTAALPWQFRMGYALNIAGGATTFTATPSVAAAFKAFYVAEYSGFATSGALDFVTALQQSTGTARNAGAAQTNSAAGTLIGLLMDYDLLATPTAGLANSRAAVWRFGGALDAARPEDENYATSGSRQATWTTNTGAESFAGAMFLLDAGGGGGGGRRRPGIKVGGVLGQGTIYG